MDMDTNPQVAVLMATYNGEKYLKEQIDSILGQTYSRLKLIVRDDGSVDKTVDILDEYIKKDDRIILLKNKDLKHGAYRNFWNLIHYAKNQIDADYIFLSDQDDVWKLNKIESSIELFLKNNNERPLLLYSDMEVINECGELIYQSYDAVMRIGKVKPQVTYFTRDIFWGCTMAFNGQLLKQIPLMPLDDRRIDIMSHDTYLAEFAASFGDVIYLDDVTIEHRKHSNNVTGNSTLLYNRKTITKKIFGSSFEEKSKKHARTYAQSLIAIEVFEKNGFSNNDLILMSKAIKKGGFIGIRLFFRYRVKKRQFTRNILLYWIMLTKSYKKHMIKWMNCD